jgi:hypothetical protein
MATPTRVLGSSSGGASFGAQPFRTRAEHFDQGRHKRDLGVSHHACMRVSDSTESRKPTVFNTASKVLSVGLPLGESAR